MSVFKRNMLIATLFLRELKQLFGQLLHTVHLLTTVNLKRLPLTTVVTFDNTSGETVKTNSIAGDIIYRTKSRVIGTKNKFGITLVKPIVYY